MQKIRVIEDLLIRAVSLNTPDTNLPENLTIVKFSEANKRWNKKPPVAQNKNPAAQ